MAQNLILNILAKDKTRAAFRGIKAGLTNLRASIFSVQSAIIGIGGGLVIKSLIKAASDVENLNIRFAFLFGNVKEGTKAFNTLINFAAKVPFSLEEISEASGNLAVVAKDAEELNEVLKVTGNVAAVTGLDFALTATQIQRSFAGGIAAADVFRERGVRALLGFKAGMTITAEETKKRFFEVFGPNGKFGKATEVLATSFSGTLSMLGDKLFKFKLQTNEAGFFDFIKNSLVVVNKLIEQNSQAMGGFASMVGTTLVNVIKQAMMGVARLLDLFSLVFKAVALGIGGMVDLIKALPAGIRELGIIGFLMLGKKGKMLVVAISALVKLLGIDLEKISNKLFGAAKDTEAWGKNSEGVAKFIKMVEENMVLSKKQMTELLSSIKKAEESTENIGLNIFKVAEVVGEQIKKDFESINNTVGKMILGGVKNFSRALAEAVVLGKQLNQSLKELAQKLLVDILAFAIQLVLQRHIENFLIEKGWIVSKKKLENEKKITNEVAKQNMLRGFGSFFSKGFAQGGAVSKGKPILVGERGPEMFVPNSSGQITQNARGTGGGSVNVNFSITTLDATGFSEMLAQNRATITSIINNAMNEKGSRGIV